uniref:Uncharacterized protein n=1 Tax=Anguilla anguilla TaxID=7936 RepID=A0A0E9R2Z4_ANGAN
MSYQLSELSISQPMLWQSELFNIIY